MNASIRSVLRTPIARLTLALAVAVLFGVIGASPSSAQTVESIWPGDVLNGPTRPVIDSQGNLYVPCQDGDFVRIAADGTATVLGSGFDFQLPFLGPVGLAVDDSDNVFVASLDSNTVFRFAPDGASTVVLDATGDGFGNALEGPQSLAAVGTDLWVAGTDSDNVFHVSPAGVVTLVLDAAGLGPGQTLDEPRVVADRGEVFILGVGEVFRVGPGLVVTEVLGPTGDGLRTFDLALDLSVDIAGTVFVADNLSVFSIAANGQIMVPYIYTYSSRVELASDPSGSTWVGHGAIFSAAKWQLVEMHPSGWAFSHIQGLPESFRGLTADDAGNLYWLGVADPQSVFFGGPAQVLRRAPNGDVTVLFDPLGFGAPPDLDNALGPVLGPDGTLFVTGNASNNALRISPAGVVDLLPAPVLQRPVAVHADRAQGLLVADLFSSEVLRFDVVDGTGEILLDASGDGLGNPCLGPNDVITDSLGNVWVAALWSDNVFRIDPAGVITQVLDASGAGGQLLAGPSGLAVDADDNVFVACEDSHNVFRIAPSGVVTPVLTLTGDGVHQLVEPKAVAVDWAGNIFVAGATSDNVFRVTPGGVVSQIADSAGAGPGEEIEGPVSLAVTWDGDVYVACEVSDNLLHIDAAGGITEIMNASGDGQGNLMDEPSDVEVDAFGTVYVTSQFPHNVFRRTIDGTVTLLIDEAGAGPEAPLKRPADLSLDLSGTVYVAGSTSNTVLSVTQDDWWIDLGGSSSGSNGRPTMVCKGDLTLGSVMDRVLTNVPPDAFMLAWIAVSSTPFDALGGTVHAFPFSQQLFFVADPTGASELALTWPPGLPSGVDIYLQFIVQDLAVPADLTLSNATMRTTP